MDVLWSENAQLNYLDIIEQTFEKWNLEIVMRFESQVNNLIEKISEFNYICPSSKIVNLHRCIVNELISLIYTVEDDILKIVALIYNQSNHNF